MYEVIINNYGHLNRAEGFFFPNEVINYIWKEITSKNRINHFLIIRRKVLYGRK
jgi:hypothetical protein